MIDWKFPETGGGMEVGLHDSGIETFRGNPVKSLTRESLQNILDAKVEGINQPVRAKFEFFKISLDNFPGKDELEKILGLCKEEENNEETEKFLNNAVATLNKSEVAFLKISDYNTTGLTGSDKLRNSKWHRLTKSVGISNKDSTSGGSFGIGKHASFVCSALRTVFYVTKDIEGKYAFQGVSKLITHLGENGKARQATGFYGKVEDCLPLKGSTLVNDIFHRNEIGTDIFIAGFKYQDKWETEIIQSVLENFFVAIYEKKLEVEVGSHTINAENLPSFIEKYIKNEAQYNADKYFEALVSDDKLEIRKEDFEGLGEVVLYILKRNDLHKKIAMVRSTGMTIRERQNYSIPVKYAGVLIAKGKKLNKFLRSIENPSHTDWEEKRHDNPTYARKIMNQLKKWINDEIKELMIQNIAEEYNIEELAQYLPDEIEINDSIDENSTNEGETSKPKEIKLEKVEHTRRTNEEVFSGEGEAAASSEDEEYNNEDGLGDGPGNGSGDGAEDGPGDEPGDRPGNGSGDGAEDGPGDEPGDRPGNGSGNGSSDETENRSNRGRNSIRRNPIIIKSKRIFCTNPRSAVYNIIITSETDGVVYITINVVGEEKSNPAELSYAKDISNGESLKIQNKNKLGPIHLIKGSKTKLEVQLQDLIRSSLEVKVSES